MKQIANMAFLLSLAFAGLYAQPGSVKMTFSGTAGASTIDLRQPNTTTGEENLAGNGAMGEFTFRLIKASTNAPQPSSTCSGLFFPNVAGGGLFRFQDGSLLQVNLTGGGDCIDVVHMVAHCTLVFAVAGGTGRFASASGVLTLTETARPTLFDALSNPVFFSETGEFTGTISGIGNGGQQESRQ